MTNTAETGDRAPSLTLELYTSSFCGACAQARAVLHRAASYIPGAKVTEFAVESDPEHAAAVGITATPTVIVRTPDGSERRRAAGVPTLDHVLYAAVGALGL